eukprot:246297_1
MKCGLPLIYSLVDCVPFVSSTLQLLLVVDPDCELSTHQQIEFGTLFVITLISSVASCYVLSVIEDLSDLFKPNESKPSLLSSTNLISLTMLYVIQYLIVIHIYCTFQYTTLCNSENIIADISKYLFLSWICIYAVVFVLIIIVITWKIKISFSAQFALFLFGANVQFIFVLVPMILQFILVSSNKCDNIIGFYLFEAMLNPIIAAIVFILGIVMLSKSKWSLMSCIILLFMIHYAIIVHTCQILSSGLTCGDFESMRMATFVFFMILATEYSVATIGACLYCVFYLCVNQY